jgi:hypothetical protein
MERKLERESGERKRVANPKSWMEEHATAICAVSALVVIAVIFTFSSSGSSDGNAEKEDREREQEQDKERKREDERKQNLEGESGSRGNTKSRRWGSHGGGGGGGGGWRRQGYGGRYGYGGGGGGYGYGYAGGFGGVELFPWIAPITVMPVVAPVVLRGKNPSVSKTLAVRGPRSRSAQSLRVRCHRLFWSNVPGAPTTTDKHGKRVVVAHHRAGVSQHLGGAKTRFFESLVMWGLKTGLDKFKDGFLDASKEKGGALAKSGIGWVLGSVFGIDLSKPDQQEITNQKLEAISKTLEEHTIALANIENKVDETNRLLTSFISLYVSNRETDLAVDAFRARNDGLRGYTDTVETYSEQLRGYAEDASAEAAARVNPDATQKNAIVASGVGFSSRLRTSVRRLCMDIETFVETAYNAILKAVTESGATNILLLFETVAKRTRQGGAVYPRYMSPDMLDALWVHYYGLYATFLQASDLLVEASHLNPDTLQVETSSPRLTKKLEDGVKLFEAERVRRMPRYLPLNSEIPFFIDPEGQYCLSAIFLTNPNPLPSGAPAWATSIWSRPQAEAYLKTAVIGGLRDWRLPKYEVFRDLAAEAHNGPLKLSGTTPGVRPLFDALGFRLDYPAVGYTNGILTASGQVFLMLGSWVPEAVPSTGNDAGHLVIWRSLSPNVT